jgi:hypothetical protein
VNKQLKAAWIDALRSGEYEQGDGQLQKGNRFCCLGVLCLAAEKIGFAEAERFDGQLRGMYITGQPEPIKRGVRAFEDDLVHMNDNEGKKFPEIADWIEENIPGEP